MTRTQAPPVLGLVAGEASAPVSPQVLKKRGVCCQCRSVRLIRRDLATRVGIDLELRDDLGGSLSTPYPIWKQLPHFLLMGNFASDSRRGGPIEGFVRPSRQRQKDPSYCD